MHRLALTILALLAAILPPEAVHARTIRAEVAAFEQPIFYNRFGSFNPYGTIYALQRDIVPLEGGKQRIGLPSGPQSLCPGEVRLADGKRPRPLVLRGNVGDTLEIDFTNLLADTQPGTSRCQWSGLKDPLAAGFERSYRNLGSPAETLDGEKAAIEGGDWPLTRLASISIVGLPLDQSTPGFLVDRNGKRTTLGDAFDPRISGIQAIAPGETIRYRYELTEPGVHLFLSHGAPAGGEGDGGSLTHGLFGAVVVEPRNSRWYRSQVSREDLLAAQAQTAPNGYVAFEATRTKLDPARPEHAIGDPLLGMLRPMPDEPGVLELVHGDLTAIVLECPLDLGVNDLDREACTEPVNPERPGGAWRRQTLKQEKPAFREFVIIFHDELKTFYADAFKELGSEEADGFSALAGIRDGFAINYGSSGLGTVLLANRKGIGPAKDCVECAYEEFFLESWANGDPALLAGYADDPSNVYHSYLNDRVVFRNLHAGPKETHVFHLHAHQWLSSRAEPGQPDLGTYLDSQTIAPLQGFSYPIYYGGSGNRNLTVGDSIFHCHLYPHFAQGMWSLWRVHDVLEAGDRRLPDGTLGAGTDPFGGPRLAADGRILDAGAPIPALIPLPQQALAPRPTYGTDGMPGYPFFSAGEAGHRAPQPPLDMALDEADKPRDGGLPRHIVARGERRLGVEDKPDAGPNELVRRSLLAGDFTMELDSAVLALLPDEGTPRERRAMAFHAGDTAAVRVESSDGRRLAAVGGGSYDRKGYKAGTPERIDDPDAIYWVNGRAPQRGAPFADPCGPAPERTYNVSAVWVDLVANKDNWHDPQARINVLSDEVDRYVTRTPTGDRPKRVGGDGEVKPFFFRAESGDCVVFRHTNRLPKNLRRDDFQVGTPTDTLGQHIHLVKFDVTSADGSGNGFNYEDGTFAPDAVAERLEAAHATGGGVIERRMVPAPLPVPQHDPATGELVLTPHYQTTTQRWYADPLLTSAGRGAWDRTLRSVFTHDHFGPSSIQQHGFYSALLVEPEGAEWYHPDGTRMSRSARNMKAVGSQAIIKDAKDRAHHGDHREFALAIADFALLYDPSGKATPDMREKGLDGQLALAKHAGLGGQVLATLQADRDHFRKEHGRPVDPPKRPEAISVDHHNPYLVNYRHEPLPLRIARAEGQGGWTQKEHTAPNSPGDPAAMFDSRVHGEPATEILKGYAGETAQFRIVQGAQEVQHTFRAEGFAWNREISDRRSTLVAAQELGISEHFEVNLDAFPAVARGASVRDHLYSFGTTDALWNGAWGLVRVYQDPDAPDRCKDGQPPYRPDPARPGEFMPNHAGCGRIGDRLAAVGKENRNPHLGDLPPLAGKAPVNIDDFLRQGVCPAEAPIRQFDLRAVSAATLAYDPARRLSDRAGLVYALADPAKEAVRQQANGGLAPLVLRALPGECIRITLTNNLPDGLRLDDKESDANDGHGMLPRIVPFNAAEMTPSRRVSISPQLLSFDPAYTGGGAIGLNASPLSRVAEPDGNQMDAIWYAGRIVTRACHGSSPEPKCKGAADGAYYLEAQPLELGVGGLLSLADPIEHPSQGLVGAIVVEPVNARFLDPRSGVALTEPPHGLEALMRDEAGKITREFVVLYQDGLGLRVERGGGSATPVKDCPICDDSYDLGEKGANYRSAPFWLRQADPTGTRRPAAGAETINLNDVRLPANFLIASGTRARARPFGPVPAPIMRAEEGERLVFRVVEPAGRARQRVFTLLGHGYPDLGLDHFGSPNAALVAPGKTQNVVIDRARKGYWLWRDGPAFMFSGGAWGVLEVRPKSNAQEAAVGRPGAG